MAGPARGHVRSFAPVLLPTPPGRAETHVAWGSRRHHTGTRGWAGVGLVIRAGTEEAPGENRGVCAYSLKTNTRLAATSPLLTHTQGALTPCQVPFSRLDI